MLVMGTLAVGTTAYALMQACGLDLEDHPELKTTDFYTCHEGLLLGYEQALTREDSTLPPGNWYCTSGESSPGRVRANKPIGAAPIISAPRRASA